MPGVLVSAVYTLSSVHPTVLQSGNHCIDEEMEAQRGSVSCPSSHSQVGSGGLATGRFNATPSCLFYLLILWKMIGVPMKSPAPGLNSGPPGNLRPPGVGHRLFGELLWMLGVQLGIELKFVN